MDENSGVLAEPVRGKPFRPGRSGNPKGRPKKGMTWTDVLNAAFDERIVTKDGKKTKLTYKQAVAQIIRKEAISGNDKLIRIAMERMEGRPVNYNAELVDPNRPAGVLTGADAQRLQEIFNRSMRPVEPSGPAPDPDDVSEAIDAAGEWENDL